jgi:hypothetical protein
VFYKDQRQVYRVSEFDTFPWLDHGFGTRLAEGWVPGPLATLHQIHSTVSILAGGREGQLGDGDALLSNTVGYYVGVRTADCTPILMVDTHLRAVAAIHAGWRGTAGGIAAEAVRAMEHQFGSRRCDLLAAIGPGICGECYVVGPEVAAQFRAWFPERSDLDRETAVDLAEANRRQLVAAGLDPARIYMGRICTIANPLEFHSHRGMKGNAGRMISAIAVRLDAT